MFSASSLIDGPAWTSLPAGPDPCLHHILPHLEALEQELNDRCPPGREKADLEVASSCPI
jgi:hypothetical protein